jgi:hypothetical protein
MTSDHLAPGHSDRDATVRTGSDEHEALERLASRLYPGATVAVPASWLACLGELDQALAEIDPAYRFAHLAERDGRLVCILDDPQQPGCCTAWEDANPRPSGDDSAWALAYAAHQHSVPCLRAEQGRAALFERLQRLVDVACALSPSW